MKVTLFSSHLLTTFHSSKIENLIQVYFDIGIIIGRPYIVSPSTCHEAEDSSEEMDQPDLNTQSKQTVPLKKLTLQYCLIAFLSS